MTLFSTTNHSRLNQIKFAILRSWADGGDQMITALHDTAKECCRDSSEICEDFFIALQELLRDDYISLDWAKNLEQSNEKELLNHIEVDSVHGTWKRHIVVSKSSEIKFITLQGTFEPKDARCLKTNTPIVGINCLKTELGEVIFDASNSIGLSLPEISLTEKGLLAVSEGFRESKNQ
ncbi:MAG: hypothetical protein ACRC2T_05180 [Thermoguttaceae bacterium]